ncbi:MAG: Chlorinase [Methanosaeta sp. PtaB.Bin039]|nr:MAG: Chlorinase [Methanosaeta sp. PtaB.Bin039]OPY44551.1 MAG: Chlorinase [Methanosaeta sp. PtaU1.Bin028]
MRTMNAIVTLLTDFGSLYPSQMKGVILQQCPGASLVDIAHDIPAHDIRAGAFALFASARYFPAGTIHLAVVDPGVGTNRAALVVESGSHIFLGPDNGLLMPAARSLGLPSSWQIHVPEEASPTFHGRDVFAAAAGKLLAGARPADLGSPIKPRDLDWGEAVRIGRGWETEVIYVDRFGNMVLNMADLPPSPLRLKGRRLRQVRTYSEGGPIEPLIILGSHGYWEIAVNCGRADRIFGLAAGDRILLEEGYCSE